MRLDDVELLILRTEGVSPAFIKELLRKAAMVAAGEGTDEQLIVTDAHVNAALDELLAETGSLTRLLLGSHRPTAADDQGAHGLATRGHARRQSAGGGRCRGTGPSQGVMPPHATRTVRRGVPPPLIQTQGGRRLAGEGQAERVPGRVQHDANALATAVRRLPRGFGSTRLQSGGHGDTEVVDPDLEVEHLRLLARLEVAHLEPGGVRRIYCSGAPFGRGRGSMRYLSLPTRDIDPPSA